MSTAFSCPVFGVLVAAVALGETIGWATGVSLVMAVVGMGLLVHPDFSQARDWSKRRLPIPVRLADQRLLMVSQAMKVAARWSPRAGDGRP